MIPLVSKSIHMALIASLLAGPALALDAPPPAAIAAPEAVYSEIARLRDAFNREVPHHLDLSATRGAEWFSLARAGLATANMPIERPQLLVIVDRNPRVQEIVVVLAVPQGEWQVVGGAHVSTGSTGRWDHYVTPVGVFHASTDILGYRAQGTKNENGIRGLGVKGSRVWDFGWQVAMKGWTDPPNKGDRTAIRLEMHATDPDVLEQRLGRPASQGCIRIPTAMNRFLDRHGVLDADYERAADTDVRFRAVLLPNRTPTPLAGNTLVVVDSHPTVTAANHR